MISDLLPQSHGGFFFYYYYYRITDWQDPKKTNCQELELNGNQLVWALKIYINLESSSLLLYTTFFCLSQLCYWSRAVMTLCWSSSHLSPSLAPIESWLYSPSIVKSVHILILTQPWGGTLWKVKGAHRFSVVCNF
jgi:hypothetical protein